MPDGAPELQLILQMVALLGAVGVFAGFIAGLLGIGGGIVLVPGLFYIFDRFGYAGGDLMQICLATSLATILVTSLRAVRLHHARGAVDIGILRRWAPGIVLGAAAGVVLAARLPDAALQVIFGLLGLLVGLHMAVGRSTWRLADAMPEGLPRLVFSSLIGGLSVLMGIGGGALAVVTMTLHGVPILRAVATAAGFGLLIALPSVAGFLFVGVTAGPAPPWTIGSVNIPAFAVLSLLTVAVAPLGVRLAHALPPERLRPIFAGVLGVLSVSMLWSGLT